MRAGVRVWLALGYAFGLFLPPWTGRCWACVGLGGKSKASGGYGVGTAYGEGMAMGGVGG
jgi:hypothetical protein